MRKETHNRQWSQGSAHAELGAPLREGLYLPSIGAHLQTGAFCFLRSANELLHFKKRLSKIKDQLLITFWSLVFHLIINQQSPNQT